MKKENVVKKKIRYKNYNEPLRNIEKHFKDIRDVLRKLEYPPDEIKLKYYFEISPSYQDYANEFGFIIYIKPNNNNNQTQVYYSEQFSILTIECGTDCKEQKILLYLETTIFNFLYDIFFDAMIRHYLKIWEKTLKSLNIYEIWEEQEEEIDKIIKGQETFIENIRFRLY